MLVTWLDTQEMSTQCAFLQQVTLTLYKKIMRMQICGEVQQQSNCRSNAGLCWSWRRDVPLEAFQWAPKGIWLRGNRPWLEEQCQPEVGPASEHSTAQVSATCPINVLHHT